MRKNAISKVYTFMPIMAYCRLWNR